MCRLQRMHDPPRSTLYQRPRTPSPSAPTSFRLRHGSIQRRAAVSHAANLIRTLCLLVELRSDGRTRSRILTVERLVGGGELQLPRSEAHAGLIERVDRPACGGLLDLLRVDNDLDARLTEPHCEGVV